MGGVVPCTSRSSSGRVARRSGDDFLASMEVALAASPYIVRVTYGRPRILIERLPRKGAREDFLVRAIGPGDTDYSFPLFITYTALGMWDVDGYDAASDLAEVLAESHGTAMAFPKEGFWFDSYTAGTSLPETCNVVRELGWRAFLVPAARQSLGAEVFRLLDGLDEICLNKYDRPFMRPLDVLFEPSQALEDLEAEVSDHPHFIYRLCILSGIVDRFDFDRGDGSLNGLTAWLEDLVGPDAATELTTTYKMLKRLRRQYPIHESYTVNAEGERQRRNDIVEAERYFDLDGNSPRDWSHVFEAFLDATRKLHECLRAARE